MSDNQKFVIRLTKTSLYFGIVDGVAGFNYSIGEAKVFEGDTREALRPISLIFDVKPSDVAFEECRVATVEDQTVRFCNELSELLADYNRENGYKWSTFVAINVAKRFVRVYRKDSLGGDSIWFLVDRKTGDILKPAGYSGGPANKVIRGNVGHPASIFWGRTISPCGLISLR